PPSPTTAPMTLEQQFNAALFDAINGTRGAAGLTPLNYNAQLQAASEQYIHLLFSLGRLEHGLDGQPWDRAQRAGYPSPIVGEVLASVSTTEALDVHRDTGLLMQTWLNSPPHLDILLSVGFAFSDLGVGCA